MNELEIVYFVDKKKRKVEPFVKEKGDTNKDKFMLDSLNEVFASFGKKEENEDENRLTFLTGYYIDLLKKGHTFQEMDRMLMDAFHNAISSVFLEPIMEHRAALMEANKAYLENELISGLSAFYNMPSTQTGIRAHYAKTLNQKYPR